MSLLLMFGCADASSLSSSPSLNMLLCSGKYGTDGKMCNIYQYKFLQFNLLDIGLLLHFTLCITYELYFSLIYQKTDQEDYKEKSHDGPKVVALEMRDNNFVHHQENIQKKGNLR